MMQPTSSSSGWPEGEILMDRSEWYRITSAALKLRNARLAHALGMEVVPYLFTKRQQEALQAANEEYEKTILEAWAKYQPTLPPDHAVPNEVERLLKQREKRLSRTDT